MLRFSVLLFCFLFTTYAYANVYEHKISLKDLSVTLPQIESIKCKFKQEKTFQNIQKPLISLGDFEFKKNEGVFFYTNYPIKSNVSYTNKNYKQINDIINCLSNKKYSRLEKDFEFYYTKEGNVWIIGLIPKNKDISEYLKNITIEGEDYIKNIKIFQKNGNKTELWFTK